MPSKRLRSPHHTFICIIRWLQPRIAVVPLQWFVSLFACLFVVFFFLKCENYYLGVGFAQSDSTNTKDGNQRRGALRFFVFFLKTLPYLIKLKTIYSKSEDTGENKRDKETTRLEPPDIVIPYLLEHLASAMWTAILCAATIHRLCQAMKRKTQTKIFIILFLSGKHQRSSKKERNEGTTLFFSSISLLFSCSLPLFF